MRVLFCWTDISGYMGACWRAFEALPTVESSHVIAWKVGAGEQSIAFNESLMAGISHDLLDAKQKNDEDLVFNLVRQHPADVIVLPGWFHRAYTELPFRKELSDKKFVMTMDTPFTGSMRQRLGRFRKWRYLDRMDGVICGGERAFQLARWLKIPEHKILRGLYGFDSTPLEGLHAKRLAQPGGWPKKFVYVGRYVSDKAIDVMVEGYKQYRAAVKNPWPLDCYGRGVDQPMLNGVPGIQDHGFVQPEDLPEALVKAGAYLIASRYEPWGVSLAEAAYAGLPVLCTKSCGAAVELVRHLHSGYVFPTDRPRDLSQALLWAHAKYESLPAIGMNGIHQAQPFGMNKWANRWAHFFEHTILQRPITVPE